MSFKPQIVCHFSGGQGGVSCFRTDPAALGGAVACWDWVWIYQKRFDFIHQLFIYLPSWGHVFLENHRKIRSFWVLSHHLCDVNKQESKVLEKHFLNLAWIKPFPRVPLSFGAFLVMCGNSKTILMLWWTASCLIVRNLGFSAVQAVCFNEWSAFLRWLWWESKLMCENVDT